MAMAAAVLRLVCQTMDETAAMEETVAMVALAHSPRHQEAQFHHSQPQALPRVVPTAVVPPQALLPQALLPQALPRQEVELPTVAEPVLMLPQGQHTQ